MTSRKLNEIASGVEDMSVTLEEIKDQLSDNAVPDHEKPDQIHREMIHVTDQIDTIVDRGAAELDKGEQPE